MPQVKCPSSEFLAAYVNGTLPEAKAAALERHLESCESCQRRLEEAEARPGSVVKVLRQSRRATESPDAGPVAPDRAANSTTDKDTGPTQRSPVNPPGEETLDFSLGAPPSTVTRNPLTPEADASTGRSRRSATPGGAAGRAESSSVTIRESPAEGETLFGNYVILHKIAQGGMGAVYKARQRGVNRLVALKMILAGQFAGEEERRRFLAEAEAAGQLDHPHIVPVYEVGEHDGQPFFSMGYVEGTTLKALIADGPLPPRRAAELMATIADAVESAHAHGVIHRDLKPSNVLIDQNGQPRVTDFGLAKRAATDSSITSTGQILGTPSFMPPEQALGKLDQVGPLSDVYSLGATFYCLLTGRAPFQAATAVDTLMQVIQEDPVPPRQLNASVPVDLETICLKCLQKDRGDRYASAAALREDLEGWLSDRPIVARPVSASERFRKWVRRNPMIAGLSSVAAVALIAGTIVSTVFWLQAKESANDFQKSNVDLGIANKNLGTAIIDLKAANASEKNAQALATRRANEAIAAEKREKIAREDAEKETDRARRKLYLADMQLADRAYHDEDLGAVIRILEAQRPPKDAPQKDLRGFEWYYLRSRCFDDDVTFRGHSHRVESVAWRPDETEIASADAAGNILVWDAAAGETRLKLAYGEPKQPRLSWNKRGDLLLAAIAPIERNLERPSPPQLHRVVVWEAATGKQLLEPTMGTAAAWSPDGKSLAVVGAKNEVTLWDSTKNVRRTLASTPSLPTAVVWHPRGNELCVVDQTHVRVLSVETGEKRLELGPFPFLSTQAAWSAGGTLIAATTSAPTGLQHRVLVWKAEDGTLIHQFSDLGCSAELTWIGDTGYLSNQTDEATALFSLRSGMTVDRIPSHASSIYQSNKILTAKGTLALRSFPNVDQPTGRPSRTWTGHIGTVRSLAWSPSKKRFASGGADGTVRIWMDDTDTARPSVRSPDGRWEVAFTPQTRKSELRDTEGKLPSVEVTDKSLLWSSDGSRLAIWNAVNAAASVKPAGNPAGSPQWRTMIRVFDARKGEMLVEREVPQAALSGSGMAWNADATLLTHAARDVTVYDATTLQAVDTVWKVGSPEAAAMSVFPVHTVSWRPQGDQLALCGVSFSPVGARPSVGFPPLEHLVFVADRDGKILRSAPVRPTTDRMRGTYHPGLAWNPAGDRIAFTSWDMLRREAVTHIWNPESGELEASLYGPSSDPHSLAWSADGKRIAVGTDHTVRLWDLDHRARLIDIAAPYPVNELQWRADGRALIGNAHSGPLHFSADRGYENEAPLPDERLRVFERAPPGQSFF